MTVDSAISNEQVIFVTGGYDHTIKIWQPHTGVCQRTCQHTDSVSFNNLAKQIICICVAGENLTSIENITYEKIAVML